MAESDPRFEHVRGVLRMGVGDSFDVGEVNGPVGRARIERIEGGEVCLAIDWGEVPPLPPPIGLLIGLPRPQTARKILQEATTLGVRRMDFFAARKGDPAYRASKLWSDRAWEEYLIKGAEQAFDTHLPEVQVHDSLEAALAGLNGKATRIALDVYEGSQRLSTIAVGPEAGAVLAIGPERGWAPSERDLLRDHAFTLAHLSNRVLRVETASLAAITLVQSAMGLV